MQVTAVLLVIVHDTRTVLNGSNGSTQKERGHAFAIGVPVIQPRLLGLGERFFLSSVKERKDYCDLYVDSSVAFSRVFFNASDHADRALILPCTRQFRGFAFRNYGSSDYVLGSTRRDS